MQNADKAIQAAFKRLLLHHVQSGRCPICDALYPSSGWHLDHDHDCNHHPVAGYSGYLIRNGVPCECIRGVLCGSCNSEVLPRFDYFPQIYQPGARVQQYLERPPAERVYEDYYGPRDKPYLAEDFLAFTEHLIKLPRKEPTTAFMQPSSVELDALHLLETTLKRPYKAKLLGTSTAPALDRRGRYLPPERQGR